MHGIDVAYVEEKFREDSKESIVKFVNKQRLARKDKWYFISIIFKLNEKFTASILCKGYNTWIQLWKTIIKDNDTNETLHKTVLESTMDLSVKEYKEWLKNSVDASYNEINYFLTIDEKVRNLCCEYKKYSALS